MSEQLRIATWNLDHASNGSRSIELQIKQILNVQPDILVLTETCPQVDLSPHGYTCLPSKPNKYGKFYSAICLGPRVSLIKQVATYDPVMAVASHVATPLRELLVYGTIITYHGDKGPYGTSPAWVEHCKSIGDHGRDWARLSSEAGGHLPLLVAGDFNRDFPLAHNPNGSH